MKLAGLFIIAVAAVLLTRPGFAQDYQDCRSTCLAERDTRNMDCPSPYDIADNSQERSQCLKASQAAYLNCVKQCPAPPPGSSSPGEQRSPPATSY